MIAPKAITGHEGRSAPRLMCFLIILLAVSVRGAAPEFDAGKGALSVEFRGQVSPYRITGVFVLPGERLEVRALTGKTETRCTFQSPQGRVVEERKNRWVWKAPQAVGDFSIIIRSRELADSLVLNVFVMAPFDSLEGEYLDGYCVGEYPSAPLRQLSIYELPAGFIRVTEENRCTPVGPHFELGQFLCKQSGGYPKYLVLREKLVLKLELILEKLNEAGYRCDTFHIMSGYRTPHYNRAIGNVHYSRHLWGGAADIFVDCNPLDGMMDDLNSDGEINIRDAGVLYDIVDGMYGKPWYERFAGGLARYGKTSSHGPFVHVDVRGTRARW